MSDSPPVSPAHEAALATRLRALTPARVGLPRTGVSQLTRDVLAFQLAHAQARDAVHAQLQVGSLSTAVAEVLANSIHPATQILALRSAADDRAIYLQRPDLGRVLNESSRTLLTNLGTDPADLAIVVADGLSALAVERHALPLLNEFLALSQGLRLAPICIVEQGRVAIGDEIGFAFAAKISVVLIGERPGLSSPDSLGIYITWQPQPGRTDAERNCISNIRAEGLSYREAANRLALYIAEASRCRLTGVALKAEADDLKQLSESRKAELA